MFDEEKELLEIRDLIINNTTWRKIVFTEEDGHTKINAVDNHGTTYKMEINIQ